MSIIDPSNPQPKQPLPNGQVAMGDINDLNLEDMQTHQGPQMVAEPVQWEEFDATPTKKMYRPTIAIPGLAKYDLEWRDQPEFFEGERQMYSMVFANVCSNYLFGVDMFIEKKKGPSVELRPNPQFAKLSTIPMPSADKERIRQVEQTPVGTIPEGLLPLTITDTDLNPTHTITCTEMAGFKEWTNELPPFVEIASYKPNGKLITKKKYRQHQNK